MHRVSGYKDYYTQAGDTFDSLALQMYDEEKLAHHIINFNPQYSGMIVFEANVRLRLPIIEGAEAPETLPPWRRDV